MINKEEFRYKYETHLHTCEASACAKNSALEILTACKEHGYSGAFITNHAWGGNTCIDRSLDWEEWIRQYAAPYYASQEWSLKNDFPVFFGLEAGFNGTEFLIYGVSPEYLIAHPEFKTADIPTQYRLVHEAGGMVIHAHPFREEFYIPEIRLFPEYVDGVEGINATHSNHLSKAHNDPKFDTLAIEYANKHNLPMTAGSDIHTTLVFGGGILTKEKINSSRDFMDLIKSDKMYLLTNGDDVYDRYGNKV